MLTLPSPDLFNIINTPPQHSKSKRVYEDAIYSENEKKRLKAIYTKNQEKQEFIKNVGYELKEMNTFTVETFCF